MTILATVFLALSLLNLVLIAWQWWVASQFPLHRRATNLDQSPAVTLLKPLKGSDPETVECLRSWFTQNYSGPVQILFGVASADDPVCAVLRELITAQPGCEAQLVVCGEPRWPNAKVATLMQLQKIARHEILIVSDADVRVPPDLIEQMVVHFREADVEAQRESLRRVGVQALACATGERGARDKLKLELQSRAPVGLVSCFYRFANPTNFAMRWEAFATNADFWSQVLQAQSLKPLDFALGAVMAVGRRNLAAIGGFEALADYLADDYQLGNKIAGQGARVDLSPVVVDCYSPPMNWREVWAHQLRWARTIRVCQPWPYAFSIVSNGTLWPLICLVFPLDAKSYLAAALCLGSRLATALYFEKKMAGKTSLFSLLLAPLKDMLQVIIWALAFTGSRVNWRGEEFRILAGGKLEKI